VTSTNAPPSPPPPRRRPAGAASETQRHSRPPPRVTSSRGPPGTRTHCAPVTGPAWQSRCVACLPAPAGSSATTRPSSSPTARDADPASAAPAPPSSRPSAGPSAGRHARRVALVCGKPRQRTVDAPPESSWDAFGSSSVSARTCARTEPSPHATATRRGSSGSTAAWYANPPSPAADQRRASFPTSHAASERSRDVVTASPSRTLIPNTVFEWPSPANFEKRTSRIGGVSDRPLVVAVAPSRSGTSHRRSSPPWLATTSREIASSGVPTGALSSAGVACASPAGTPETSPGRRGPAQASATHRRPRCASERCGGHRGSGKVIRSDVRSPSHDHSVTARSREPTAKSPIALRGSGASVLGIHARHCTSAARAGSLRGGDDAETSATPSAPLWWPTATSFSRAALMATARTGVPSNCSRARTGRWSVLSLSREPPPPPPPAVPNRQTRHFPPRSPETQRSGATGDTDNALTSAACPRIVRRHRREVVSHRRRLVSAEPETSRCVTPGCFAKHSAVTRLTCPTSDPTNRRHARVSSGRTRTTALRAAYAYRAPSAPPQSPSADPYQFGAGGIAIDASRPVASIRADPRARVPPRLRCVADTFPPLSTTSVDAGRKRLLGSGGGGPPGVPGFGPGANGFEGLDGDDQARVSID